MPMTDAMGATFVETKEYRRFREFCDACRRYRYIGLCCGPPGVGKTLSARRYANWDLVARYRKDAPDCGVTHEDVRGSRVVFYTPPVVITSPGRIPNDLGSLRGRLRDLLVDDVRREELPHLQAANREVDALHDHRRLTGENCFNVPPEEVARRQDEWRRILERMSGRERAQPDPTELIVIDEADRLKVTGLEQVRDIFDRGGIGVVLVGMPGLERRLARYAQLYSRVGFVHEFRPMKAEEIRMLLGSWRPAGVSLPADLLADAEGVAAIIRITGGNFRLMDRLLTQVGRILELNALKVVTREAVEAAREILVIGTA
jgi:DNA transposition AAA+ family ATPase